MITIAVTDFRGCASAQIECAPIALLAGLNAAGKTSVAHAVGSALTGNALPIAGLRTGAAGMLVRTGAATGSIEISGAAGSARLEWPEMRLAVTDEAPHASEYATGLQSIVTMAARDRLRVLAEYLHADPTRAELEAAIAAAGLDGAAVVDILWPDIEHQEWDAVLAARRERGAQLKGRWRQTTGANYGSRVAESWRPDLAGLDRAALEADVAAARRARDQAVASAAVSADERQRFEAEAELTGPRQDALERLKARLEECTAAYHSAQQARAALPAATQRNGMPCPHCGELVAIVQVSAGETRLERVIDSAIAADELRRRRMAIAEADGMLSHADADLSEVRRHLASAERAVSDSFAATERLATWPQTGGEAIDRQAADTVVARTEKRLAEFDTKVEADRIHALVSGNENVIEILAPDGLRARKLARVLEAANATLAKLSATARWAPVQVDGAANVGYGGRPYVLLSSSEQYRVRTIFAVAMAQWDGSALVICDGADILDAPSRSGMFDLLEAAGIPALVCMTLPRREMTPDLAPTGMGRSYWIEGGIVAPLEARAAA